VDLACLGERSGPFAAIEIAAAEPHQREDLIFCSLSSESSAAVGSCRVGLSTVASRIATPLSSLGFEPESLLTGAVSASNSRAFSTM
jgi:hypothetical protein